MSEELKNYLRDQIAGMVRMERKIVAPEPDEEGQPLTYRQIHDHGWDQGWAIGRREQLADILRFIEVSEIIEKVKADEE